MRTLRNGEMSPAKCYGVNRNKTINSVNTRSFEYMKNLLLLFVLYFTATCTFAQFNADISIDASAVPRPISPYIFGKNNSLSDSPSKPLSASQFQRLRDLGITIFRENGGNNASKYNWRRKLSSHPDWYNNVYAHDWDFAAKSLRDNIPSAQGVWAFQLTGKAAKTTAANFNDWAYNSSSWWDGVGQNLAGGGTINTAGGGKALADGNTELYLENWTADSTTAILGHWFGEGGLGLDPAHIRYWSMDNEPEIWDGTHDDIYPVQPDAEAFMQKYFAVAKKARELFPGIKLMGPVPANEWQWYNYKGGTVSYNGKQYPWLEYFILRVAEEEKATGIRLLDVLDIHFYPGETNNSDIVQLYRVYFDTSYIYPGANGVKKTGSSGWDASINREYIFTRCNNWLTKYMGADHGVGLSVSETGINGSNTNVTAVWYASTLGEFARKGVEIFTPWSWKTGMDEVLHLFSRYSLPGYINSVSSNEEFVSAYPTISSDRDSMVIFLVNRHVTDNANLNISLSDFPVRDGSYKTLRISNLPSNETFSSHILNALKTGTADVLHNTLSLVAPPLSITAVILTKTDSVVTQFGTLIAEAEAEKGEFTGVYAASSLTGYSGTGYVTGFDNTGDKVTVPVYVPEKNFYDIYIRYRNSGEKYQDLSVNGGFSSSVRMPASDAFNFAFAGKFLLEKGINKLSVLKSWGWSEIDKFEIYAAAPDENFDIATALVDSSADPFADSLYDFLKLQFGKRIISGQTMSKYADIKPLTGKSPMLQAGDLMTYTEGYPYLWVNGAHAFGKLDDGTVQKLIDWYNNSGKKAIVGLQWHWCSPSGGQAGTNTFYTESTSFDITKAVTPGTDEYNLIIRDIDDIASQLKRFSDAGVPVLWRPLHEAGGGWFWWGAKGPEACKKLWDILFDRLKNYHQLHNLIWVWSSPETDWYPGNDKVDIIGYDSYPGVYNYGNQKNMFDALHELTKGKKLIAMTENGPIPDPGECLRYNAPWLLFMSWANLVFEQNTNAHIKEVYNDPKVITLESDNAVTTPGWRSILYPDDWKPGYKDGFGRYLQDFSYAGYHMGAKEIPSDNRKITDVSLPPYNADNTGIQDVTAILQQAIDDVGSSGGGVVYLPAGTYRISVSQGSAAALTIRYDSTVMRGAGNDSTFLVNTETLMRDKNIILLSAENGSWFSTGGTTSRISSDVPGMSRLLPLYSVSGFKTGDQIVITSDPTEDFISDHKMSGVWNAENFRRVAFLRKIISVDAGNNFILLDAPIRYYLKTSDNARIYKPGKQLNESGIENLSLGNIENPGTGWAMSDSEIPGTGAWEVKGSAAVRFRNCVNSWIKNVNSFRPSENTSEAHLLSNGIVLEQSAFITVDSCDMRASQLRNGESEGALFLLESNECLVKNCKASGGGRNFLIRYPYSSGNVILGCQLGNSAQPSKFAGYLSMANLFDNCVLDSDRIVSSFETGTETAGGYSSTQSVFYNTRGESYYPGAENIIESRQFSNGYIIGTGGDAFKILTTPLSGIQDGYYFNSSPEDLAEGIGLAADLEPQSLYLDQFERRKNDSLGLNMYNINIIVKDSESGLPVLDASVTADKSVVITDTAGIAHFESMVNFFTLSITGEYYETYGPKQMAVFNDTSIVITIKPKTFKVSLVLLDNKTLSPFYGVTVSLASVNQVTDKSGTVNFKVNFGSNPYSFSKLSYKPETGDLFIFSDTVIVFELERISADVKFRLSDGSAPVNNAGIKIRNDSLLTNSLGIATFRQLSLGVEYSFEITHTGYLPFAGIFTLATDTVIDIVLQTNPVINISGSEDEIMIRPNPADDKLLCIFPLSCVNSTYRISELSGKLLISGKISSPEEIIRLEDLPAGAYIMMTANKNKSYYKLFLKK
jgi:hypothetical protein